MSENGIPYVHILNDLPIITFVVKDDSTFKHDERGMVTMSIMRSLGDA